MSGDNLKGILKSRKVKITELAKAIGMSQQSLSAALSALDIKSGLIEKIAVATNIPISEFFGVPQSVSNNRSSHATGNGQASINIGNSNTATANSETVDRLQERIKYLELLVAEKERMISLLLEHSKTI